MNAHQLDADGVIINTIVVESLDSLPDLVDASIGGTIGDSVVDGVLVQRSPSAEQLNAPIYDQIAELEKQQTARLIREAALGGDYALEKLTDIETEISALRAQLK